TPYAVHVKGVEIGAHGIRSGRSTPIRYALSPQGGDHTSSASDGYREFAGAVFSDSAVVCNFSMDRARQWDFLKAVTGWEITSDSWSTYNGPKIYQIQRALLLLGGPDLFWDPKVHDDNPPRFYEPLPTGPYKGKAADRKEMEEMRKNYYETIGWDENGIPSSEDLKRLGLEDVDRVLKKLRK
ncbi:MAG: aldehyde ferredoxin oxidoreductase C-terminal domain-containing protein, partial [Candidatus Bathyarchaeia archaeon]